MYSWFKYFSNGLLHLNSRLQEVYCHVAKFYNLICSNDYLNFLSILDIALHTAKP